MNDCEHQIFKPCVFLIDARSLNIDDETLGKMSRYIVERGGRAMMALPTHTDSDSVEILPKPKKGTHCTHIVAGYGAMNWTSYSEYGLVMDSAATVNILWVFGCMQAQRLLPCNAEMYSRDRIGIRPVNACTDQGLLVEKYYDDSMGETTSVSCSGFKRVERTLLEAMVGSLGLAFHKSLHVSGKIRTDVLIVLDTSDISSAKLQAARNANIPVVSFKWLLNSFKEWKLLPLHDLMSQNGNATDLDALVVEEESKEDEENLIPDSEDSESARECSPTPPVENVSVSGGDLVSLVSSQEVRGTENKSAQPISQDLSSTPNFSSKQEQRIYPTTNEGKTRKQGGNDTEDPVQRKRPRKSQGTKAPVDRGDGTDTKIIKIQKATKEKPRIHITLSGMHSREQNECLPLLRALCIPYTAGTHSWNQKFTHVITPSLRRNQKCLCALACGAWILHPSFLKACLSEESLVPEESYEIKAGNKATQIDPNMPNFWRRTIATSGKRAFEGLVCTLFRITPSSTPSREDIKAIITAGGGTVIPYYKAADASCDLIITSDVETATSSMDASLSQKCISSSEIVMWLASTSSNLSFKTRDRKVSLLLAMRKSR